MREPSGLEGDVQRLELRPDDIVVIRTDLHLTAAQAATIKDRVQALIGSHRVMVLDAGLTVEVLTPEQRAACDHPRAQRVFHADGQRVCGRCGTTLAAETPTPEPGDA